MAVWVYLSPVETNLNHNNNDNILFVQVENARNSAGCSVPSRGGVDMEPGH